MAKFQLKSGTTSKMLNLFVQDASKTTGAGLTGISNNTSGLLAHYIREGESSSNPIAIVSAVIGTFTAGGIIEIESSAMPGLYQIGLPNAVCSANAKSATVYYFGAANMVPSLLEIELTATDNQDGVRYGMTALPNAAAAASNGLPTAGAGAFQISTSAGMVLVQQGAAAGQLDATSGVVKANAVQTLGVTIPASAGYMAVDWGTVVNKTTTNALTGTTISTSQVVATVTNAVIVGSVSAGAMSGVSISSVTGAVGSVTTPVTIGAVSAGAMAAVSISSVTGSVGSVTGSVIVGSVSAGITVPANVLQVNSVNVPASAGYMAIDWGTIVNKTTSNALTGTTISTSQVAASVTAPVIIGSVSAGAMAGVSISSVTGSVGSVTGAVGSVTGAVGSVTAGVAVASVSSGILPTNFISLSIDAGGNVKTQTAIKKNVIVSGFSFVMTDNTTHVPRAGLTVSANRSIDGAAFAACTNNVTEISNGIYQTNLAAADVNGNNIMVRFVATSADDQNILIITNS